MYAESLFFGDRDGLDDIAAEGGVLLGVAAGDAVDHIHAADHLSENSVATIELIRGAKGDEELTTVGISSGVGHGNHPGLVELQITVFIHKLVTGAAHASAGWIAALGHEAFQHTVKGDTVKEAVFKGLLKIKRSTKSTSISEPEEPLFEEEAKS